MRSTTVRALAALAVLFVGVVGGAFAWFVWIRPKPPIYASAGAIPSSGPATPTAHHARAVDAARRLLRGLMIEDNVAGLSGAVAVGSRLVWAEGFGWSDVENRTAITPSTRFRLGALSKPLTAAGAALLHDRGRLDLDAPIQQYVPGYPRRQWPVTTRQLLGDVGGVHRIRGDNNDAMPTGHCASVDEAVELLTDDPLMFEPGTQHRYSIWGWTLVSAVIEKAAGERFDRFMERRVFEPLGMTRTVAAEADTLEGLANPEGPRPDYSCLAGGGAFLSTPTDLVRFGAAVMAPGLLRAGTIAAFQTPTRLASGAATTYALGWTVGHVTLAGAPTRMISHSGNPMHGAATLVTFPEVGLAVAVTANGTSADRVRRLAQQVADAFATQSPSAVSP